MRSEAKRVLRPGRRIGDGPPQVRVVPPKMLAHSAPSPPAVP